PLQIRVPAEHAETNDGGLPARGLLQRGLGAGRRRRQRGERERERGERRHAPSITPERTPHAERGPHAKRERCMLARMTREMIVQIWESEGMKPSGHTLVI